jgi:hypothetical protein
VQAINLHQLFPGSVFVTKYNGMRWVEALHEFARLISAALALAKACCNPLWMLSGTVVNNVVHVRLVRRVRIRARFHRKHPAVVSDIAGRFPLKARRGCSPGARVESCRQGARNSRP